ncbi:hypothetical protein [Bacillus sp. GbtcB10]|uniref:hypothetical protein n=1 Tax=Bacillus sp. GbtcB10 TaxID=2824755 RepID=UPI001C30778F|nr:hypothetical protein [Bacillus sp. GbtcB10]
MLSHDEILSSKGSMLIITGLTALIEEEGMTPHSAMDHIRQIEASIFPALNEIHRQSKAVETDKK